MTNAKFSIPKNKPIIGITDQAINQHILFHLLSFKDNIVPEVPKQQTHIHDNGFNITSFDNKQVKQVDPGHHIFNF